MKYELPKLKLQQIVWEDHCSYQERWRDLGTDVENTPAVIVTVGYVIAENEKYMTISACIDISPGSVSGKHVQTIIKSCIRKRVNLR